MTKTDLKKYLKNKYLNLLLVMLLIIVLMPFIESCMQEEVPVVSIVFLLGLTMTIWALNLPKKVFTVSVAISLLICLLELTLKALPPGVFRMDIALVTWSIFALFLLSCIAIMMNKLLRASRVTFDAIIGGINIYFLLAFFWALLYHIVNLLDREAFNIHGKMDITSLLYYSYNTITTLGNGDIVPTSRFAMILSSLEAITGQLFLAIFVAALMGLHISSRISDRGDK